MALDRPRPPGDSAVGGIAIGTEPLPEVIAEAAKVLYLRALKVLPPDVKVALAHAHARETSPRAREILATMLKNIEVAEAHGLLVCQDTGIPVFKVRVGRRFPFDGPALLAALTRGVQQATVEHPLRSSVCHPITRENPQTNTGLRIPVVDFEFLEGGDWLELRMMPKGSGAENQSFLTRNPVAVTLQCWRGERASARIHPDGRVEHGD